MHMNKYVESREWDLNSLNIETYGKLRGRPRAIIRNPSGWVLRPLVNSRVIAEIPLAVETKDLAKPYTNT